MKKRKALHVRKPVTLQFTNNDPSNESTLKIASINILDINAIHEVSKNFDELNLISNDGEVKSIDLNDDFHTSFRKGVNEFESCQRVSPAVICFVETNSSGFIEDSHSGLNILHELPDDAITGLSNIEYLKSLANNTEYGEYKGMVGISENGKIVENYNEMERVFGFSLYLDNKFSSLEDKVSPFIKTYKMIEDSPEEFVTSRYIARHQGANPSQERDLGVYASSAQKAINNGISVEIDSFENLVEITIDREGFYYLESDDATQFIDQIDYSQSLNENNPFITKEMIALSYAGVLYGRSVEDTHSSGMEH